MNKVEFCTQLAKNLKKLPEEEAKNAVLYYAEFLEEAGEDQEQEAIQNLGSPAQIASQIIADYAIKEMQGTQASAKKGLSTVWVVLLAVFASPIALPLAAAIAVLALSLVLVIFCFVLSFATIGITCTLSGIAFAVCSFGLLLNEPMTTLFFFGIGLVLIGIGVASCLFTVFLCKKGFGGVAKLIRHFVPRRKK